MSTFEVWVQDEGGSTRYDRDEIEAFDEYAAVSEYARRYGARDGIHVRQVGPTTVYRTWRPAGATKVEAKG